MKYVLIALPNDALGGAEQYLKNIAQYYCDKRYVVTVLFLKEKCAYGWSDLENRDNVNILYTKSVTERYGLLQFCKNALKYKDFSFDYVFTSHVHITGMVGLMIKIGLIKKKSFIGRESTSVFFRFTGPKLMLYKVIYRLGYSALDLLICQTDFMQEQFKKGIPSLYRKINVKTIPNPINLNIGQFSSTAIEIPYGNFIISAGRLIDEKGFDLLIDAFYTLKNVHKDINLVILGEGPKRSELEKKIKMLKLEKSVFLPGFVKNVYPYFKFARLCVVASRIEGFPNVLLQMMSQNNKVVSTLCAGGISTIEGLETCETGNAHDLFNAMLKTISNISSHNRQLFNEELAKRSIPSFIQTVNSELGRVC